MVKYTAKKEEMNLGDSETTRQLLLKLVDNAFLNVSFEFDSDIISYESTFETAKGDIFKVTIEKISESEKPFGTPIYYYKPLREL